MMKFNNLFFYVLVCFTFLLSSCNKHKSNNLSLEQVKYNTNKSSYSNAKLDSVQVINKITKQKVRQVLELSILYNTGNKDTEIDDALKNQILGYFYKPDSTTLKNLIAELDTFNVRNAKINRFDLKQKMYKKDTLNFATFAIEYFDDKNKSIGQFEREAQYILVPAEIQFKREFKFYFLNFYNKPLNDSTSVGVTK